MTKKDYEALANALRNVPSIKAWDTWGECVKAVALVCQWDNPRFDYQRFLKACGVSQQELRDEHVLHGYNE